MKLLSRLLIVPILFIGLFSCTESNESPVEKSTDGWVEEAQIAKTIKNVHFSFPANEYVSANKEQYINAVFEAIEHDSKLLQLDDFKDTIYAKFLPSREKMGEYTGMEAKGMALAHINSIYMVLNEEITNPPIKHEMLHLIAMMKWGYPHPSSTWLNEGFATYAEDQCNGYTVSEVYRYFMETDKLIPLDTLAADFYQTPEMIGYHQSAYLVQHLLENHSIEQFRRLWSEGFTQFESIYEYSPATLLEQAKEAVLQKHKVAPKINWEEFEKGCD